MQTFRNRLIAIAAAGVLAVLLSLVTSRHATADSTKDVVVTPLPLPVKNVDERGRVPYIGNFFCQDGLAFCMANDVAVPPNKRLVIEHVSAQVRTEIGQPISFVLLGIDTGSAAGTHYLPSHLQQSGLDGIHDIYVVNEQVLLFVEANHKALLNALSTSSHKVSVFGCITGYLVDLGS